MAVDWSLVAAPDEIGESMHALMRELFPIPRSLTGEGNRRTLERVSRIAPLELTEVPTGTPVLDWVVPREWNVREAWIDAPDGTRVADFGLSPLHVLGYSTPVRSTLTLDELRPHLFTDPKRPTVIPYRTSYHTEQWGFCLTEETARGLCDGVYDICIDATLEDGSLTYGECAIPGERPEEILVSTYICHPAQANDNLSGVVLLAELGALLGRMSLRYSYRLLFSPGSLGPISWLSRNEDRLHLIRAGLVASCVGDPGGFTYKRSRRGGREIDLAVQHALRHCGEPYDILDWIPWGGDERQFCSPGFDLPVGALSRSPADRFAEYHSSADDLDFVTPRALGSSLHLYLSVIDILERNGVWINQNPKGEPQLGRRGLYRSVGGGSSREAALLWVLSFGDGEHSALEIAERSGLPFSEIQAAVEALAAHSLVAEAPLDDQRLGDT